MQAKAIIKVSAEVILVLGAVACILQWLGIKPTDLQMTLTLPHVFWLIAGLALFGVSLWSSLRTGVWQAKRIAGLEKKGGDNAAAHAREVLRLGLEHQFELARVKKDKAAHNSPGLPRLLSYRGDAGEHGFVSMPGGLFTFYFVTIHNSEFANPLTAYTVRAKITYAHANGADGFAVTDVRWLPNSKSQSVQFYPSLAIEPNTDERLVFLAEKVVGTSRDFINQTRRCVITDFSTGDHTELKPGHWKVTIVIESDTSATYTGTGGFTVRPGDYKLILDDPPFTFTYEG